eukprot:768548-Hanusia_phi.AAC.8
MSLKQENQQFADLQAQKDERNCPQHRLIPTPSPSHHRMNDLCNIKTKLYQDPTSNHVSKSFASATSVVTNC